LRQNKRLYKQYGILSLAVHPGVIQTGLSRNSPPKMIEVIGKSLKRGVVFVKTLGAGASTSLVAALDPALGMPETGGKEGNEFWGLFD
jgi:hypothetical protein